VFVLVMLWVRRHNSSCWEMSGSWGDCRVVSLLLSS